MSITARLNSYDDLGLVSPTYRKILLHSSHRIPGIFGRMQSARGFEVSSTVWLRLKKKVVAMPYVLISAQTNLVRIDLLDTVFIGSCFSVQVNVN